MAAATAVAAGTQAGRLWRIEARGPALPGGTLRYFGITAACRVRKRESFTTEQKIEVRTFDLLGRHSPAWGQAMQFVLINDVPSY